MSEDKNTVYCPLLLASDAISNPKGWIASRQDGTLERDADVASTRGLRFRKMISLTEGSSRPIDLRTS